MGRKIKIFIACLFYLIVSSCHTRKDADWETQKLKVEICKEQWIYKDLPERCSVKVLSFSQKFKYSLQSYPNLLIGITTQNDTIAILDKDFNATLKKGIVVHIIPLSWSNDEKMFLKPSLTVSSDKRENELYCNVRIAYYGKIEE